MGVETLILVLILFMAVAALVAAETRDLLSSVIALGAAGFALSVIDLLAGAPDLALTQVVVEVLALVLLIRAVITRREEAAATSRDALRTGAVLLAGGLVIAVAMIAVGALPGLGGRAGTIPPFGHGRLATAADSGDARPVAADYLSRAAKETGAANAVTAVLLDYRAYDTLGEATVIFVSILGAYAILRRVGRRPAGAAPPKEP